VAVQVTVPVGPARAFEVFTAGVGQWWPLATHSVFGAAASVAFEQGRLVERLGERTAEWGRVLAWEGPGLLRLTWHPGTPVEEATLLTVRFRPDGSGTSVELEHDGWERHARGAEATEDYRRGWPVVLGCFVQAVERWNTRGLKQQSAGTPER
jgi:uncharacterized protein YndB with AHSA1/START domain